MWIWLLLLNLCPFAVVPLSQSADMPLSKGGAAPSTAASTTITSNKMTVKNQDNQAIFEGTVVLIRGPLIVHSDRMVVMFGGEDAPANVDKDKRGGATGGAPSKGPDAMPEVSNRAINQIEATGRVKIKKESGSATCEKAIYYRDGDKLVLTGDPVAWDKGTRVSGRRITMFLGEDRSVVEGNSHVRLESEEEAAK